MGVRNLAPKHVGRKEYLMEMPAIFKGESLTRLGQGVFVGAVATMIIGFSWGGWVRGITAENNAALRVNTALVQAYGPVCIERFKHQANVEAKWVELTKIDTWRRDDYIRKAALRHRQGRHHRIWPSRMHVQTRSARSSRCRRPPPTSICGRSWYSLPRGRRASASSRNAVRNRRSHSKARNDRPQPVIGEGAFQMYSLL